MASQLLRLRSHCGVLSAFAQGKRAPIPLTRRLLSNTKDKQSSLETSDSDSTEAVSVVDPSPVYTKEEAKEIDEVINKSSGRTGSRSEYVSEREPVVVHEMSYPVLSNKWYRVDPEENEFVQVGRSHVNRVPKLRHGLERVLFSPGVHCLEDPHSGVYNFDPYIRNITQPDEFDYDKLTPYITSSKDETLMGYARQCGKKFVGSTSSMTHVLSHLYFAISAGKGPDISSLSMAFADMPTNFTRGMRYPASIALRYHDGVYGIDADKSFDVKDSILSVLGKSLEKLLTSSPKEFEMYKKQNSWKVKDIPEENYHYTQFGEFVLRSQLDCRDDRLPRRTFDLKTRGSLAIRMDLQNYEVSKGYQIKTMKGRLQSFEREYYDMIRSAFLKYNFQTRIGNMDGIFVAYHNTARMFGFQYIPRREMDNIIYGNEATGNKAFKTVLILLGKLLKTITDQFPKQDIRVTFDSASGGGKLSIWVEVIDDQAEEAAAQQYEELGIFNPKVTKPKGKKQSTAAFDGNDPFATTEEPLESPGTDKEATEEDLEGEIDDAELDPMDYIYANDKKPILHYTMETFSTYNNHDTDSPVTVKNNDEEWYVNWKLSKARSESSDIASAYRRLRLRQATYFERASPDTPEEDLSPMIRILRRISRKDLWRNKEPKRKVIVNRSRLPSAHTIRASAALGAKQGSEEKTDERDAAQKRKEYAKRPDSGRSKTAKAGANNRAAKNRNRKPKDGADGEPASDDARKKRGNEKVRNANPRITRRIISKAPGNRSGGAKSTPRAAGNSRRESSRRDVDSTASSGSEPSSEESGPSNKEHACDPKTEGQDKDEQR